ncbi:MAG: zinc ribbon domain-containing protein [Paludibacteraceae bacterium]|nr:zinc ribbon domain-containing protein [Paludibacteraceae bacterium]
MFCRYCGKEIEEDSYFCKYCGKNIEKIDSILNKNYVKKFTSLSVNTQIFTILYGLWFVGFLSFVLLDYEYEYHHEYGGIYRYNYENIALFFIWVIAIPYVIVCLRYIWKLIRTKRMVKKNEVLAEESLLQEQEELREEKLCDEEEVVKDSNSEKLYSLVEFVRQKGKMQIIVDYNENKELNYYYLFTAFDGTTTRVDATENTFQLTSKDIAEQKDKLCVRQLENGKLVLDYFV